MPVQPRLLNLSIFINEHLRDELTLNLLAARMNLSPFHFHRKFRAYFGESLHQHIKRLRLERSAHELLHRLKPVSVVARGSGYKTLSAFSHAFSAHFGVAPTRFREVMATGRLAEQSQALRERLGPDWIERLAPERIERAAERTIGFLRVDLQKEGDLSGVCQAIEQLRPQSGAHAAHLAGAQAPSAGEMVLASVDLFGIATGAAFRVDVGQELASLEPDMRSQLGQLVLPAGRYAIFNIEGPAERVVDTVRAIYHFWVPSSGERTRVLPHYLTFSAANPKENRTWRIHVPLEDVAGEGIAVSFPQS